MSHCPYLLQTTCLTIIVCASLLELPTALLDYLDLLQGDCSPPAPQGRYIYMIAIPISL